MEPPKNSLSFLFWLFCVTFSLAGVQFVYSIQFAIGTPLFNQELKVSTSIVPIILSTAGPISGFIVQPIIGVLSDGCTAKLGRRRPFILVGTILCAVGMAVIGNSVPLGKLLGDKESGLAASDHKAALAFAIVGLWVMNLFVNVMQGPSRAIISDIVPKDKQQTGNAMVSNVMGLAAVTANVVGAQFFGHPEPYRYLFTIGIGCCLFSCIPTMIAAKEQQFVKGGYSQINSDDSSDNYSNDQTKNNSNASIEKQTIGTVFGKIYRGFRYMPSEMLRVVLLYFFSWAAFSPFMIYITQWFGVNVFHGDSAINDTKYQDGVRMGMYGLAIFAGVQWFYSFILPIIVEKLGVKFTYLFSQVLATAAFVLFLFFHRVDVGFVLMGVTAINFTTFNSVPFALVANSAKNDAGLYMGVLNSASVVAQTVTNLAAGAVVGWKGEDVSWGIAFGACLSVIACVLVFFVKVPSKTETVSETTALLSTV